MVSRPVWLAIAGDPASPRYNLLCGRISGRNAGMMTVLDEHGLRVAVDPGLQVAHQPNTRTVRLGIPYGDGTDPWGDYVDIRFQLATRRVRIDRPAFGMLPCYALFTEGILIAGSDVRRMLAAGDVPVIIDTGFIASFLAREQLRTGRTGIEGINELPGGASLVVDAVGPAVLTRLSPWTFAAARKQVRSQGEAIELLRGAILGAVADMAAPYRNILLSLSGGLDSAVVAAGLSACGAPVTGLNLATVHPSGDERRYARLVAAACGIPLAERLDTEERVDLWTSQAAHLPRPLARAVSSSSDLWHREVAAQTGADAFFGGGGGDNVFCFLSSAAPLADRLRARGPGVGSARTALDLSRMTGGGVRAVVAQGARRALKPGAQPGWPPDLRFLSRDLAASLRAVPAHPWLSPPAGIPPGKASHVEMILAFLNHLEGYGRELVRPKVSPLMSRPVVEAALRIPSWMWCDGGINRAVARQAFADVLPGPVIRRRSKGTPGGMAASLFEAQRLLIREMLSDGWLAAHDLLDQNSVTTACDDTRPLQGHDHVRLLRLVDVEAWIRSWQG